MVHLFSQKKLVLEPLQVWSKEIRLDAGEPFEIEIQDLNIHYKSDPTILEIDRPFEAPDDLDLASLDAQWRAGREEVNLETTKMAG